LQAISAIAKPAIEIKALEIDLLLFRGRAEDYTGVQQQALATYRQAKTLAETIKDNERLVQILNHMGPVLRHLGLYSEAQLIQAPADGSKRLNHHQVELETLLSQMVGSSAKRWPFQKR
jgi:hypothetical protein